jgi:glycosyltransferase involved in cell wall biosynthesis
MSEEDSMAGTRTGASAAAHPVRAVARGRTKVEGATAFAAPTHSVLCITYNQEAYVEQAIRTLFADEVGPDEVIVVDDASTDRTQSLLTALAQEFPGRITTIFNPRNLGLFRNLNQVIWLPSGDLVHLLAGDDWYEPGMFRAMNAEVARRGLDPSAEAFILVPDTLDFDGRRLIARPTSARRVERLFKTALRQNIQLFPVGISRRLFAHYGEFEPNLGLWADYLHQLTFLQHVSAAYPLHRAFPVYRRGSGISSRTSVEAQSRSFVAVVARVRRACAARLDASDHRFLAFLQRKHELIVAPGPRTVFRFTVAFLLNLLNGAKRSDLEIAGSVLLRWLFPRRRPRRT